jgi:hypothetical protein
MSDIEGDARAVAGELVHALGKPVADAALDRLAGVIAGRESAAKATGDRLTQAPPDQRTRVAEEETQRWTGRLHDRMLDDPEFARQIHDLARGDATARLTGSPRSNQNTATASGEAAIIQAGPGATVTSTINRRSTTVNIKVPGWLAIPIAFMRSHIVVSATTVVVVAGGATAAIVASSNSAGSAGGVAATTVNVDSQRGVNLAVVPPTPTADLSVTGALEYFGAANEFNSFDRDTVPYTGTGTPTAAECKTTVQHPGDGSYGTADGQILCFAFPNGVTGYAKVVTHAPSQATLQIVDLSR